MSPDCLTMSQPNRWLSVAERPQRRWYNDSVRLKVLHPWRVAPAEARAIQDRLASEVSFFSSLPEQVRYVAGVDISGTDSQALATGAVVGLTFPELEVAEVRVVRQEPGMPYVPGFLSFREVPVLVGALEALDHSPDLILVDGQGFAHPRRFGLACHLGLLTETPTIGCAKSVLCGKHDPLAPERGFTAPLIDRDEVVGMALRTRDGVSPVYVSVGHGMDLGSAAEWALACGGGLRIPESTRLAHQATAGRLVAPGVRRPV
jgi:deoxyribonuclease V